MVRRAALQRYTQHSSRGNDKEDLKQEGGESCVFAGLETDHFFYGLSSCIGSGIRSYFKKRSAISKLCLRRGKHKRIDLFVFKIVGLAIFQRRLSFASPILGPI